MDDMSWKQRQDKDDWAVKLQRALELVDVKAGKRPGQILQPKGATSRRRIKAEHGPMCYHVMSRTVNGEFLFGPVEKEAFRRLMWRMAKFAGVEIFTYVVMSNHFHILVKVPDRRKWLQRFEDQEGEETGSGEGRLLLHLSAVYSKAYMKQLRHELKSLRERGIEEGAQELLARFKRRFCDISLFLKELKERFSRWFNKQHDRRGTLWMDLFQCVCVDGEAALATIAAYIDLNPVRAGLVDDPVNYEWSGYGEAEAGSRRARRGLCKALGLPQDSWQTRALARYRIFLYDQGLSAEMNKKPGSGEAGKKEKTPVHRGFSQEARTRVRQEHGELPVARLLRRRFATFSQGVALGGEDFVRRMAAFYRETMARKRERNPQSPRGGSMPFFTLRDYRD
jgi:hypothetical protein